MARTAANHRPIARVSDGENLGTLMGGMEGGTEFLQRQRFPRGSDQAEFTVFSTKAGLASLGWRILWAGDP